MSIRDYVIPIVASGIFALVSGFTINYGLDSILNSETRDSLTRKEISRQIDCYKRLNILERGHLDSKYSFGEGVQISDIKEIVNNPPLDYCRSLELLTGEKFSN
ncbi:hypothetical protein J4216_00610 [Candidatus Woesearchaeota archaeon]|nr:hypothetical protein [Candidatus Woesearchaeota archaeon]